MALQFFIFPAVAPENFRVFLLQALETPMHMISVNYHNINLVLMTI